MRKEFSKSPAAGEELRMKNDKQLPGSHQKPVRTFEGHSMTPECTNNIISIATFLDGNRIASLSGDNIIRIWRLEDGAEMMKWVAKQLLWALVISGNGKQVVSAEGEDPRSNPKKGLCEDDFDNVAYWQLWVRDVESGRVVAGPLDGHTNAVLALDISPDGEMLASGSFDRTVILRDTNTWQRKGEPLLCGSPVFCIRFSPTSQLAVATIKYIQIWDLDRRERLAQFNGHSDFNIGARSLSLTWTRDGVHLLSAGNNWDPVIRSWDTSTWQQAGDPWTGHDKDAAIICIVLNPAGTLLASASHDCTVRLWQFPTGTEVARFKHSDLVSQVAFSVDGRSIFSGGKDKKISQWEIPEDVLTAAESDSLANTKNEARGKQKIKCPLNSEIPGQRRNKLANAEHLDRFFARGTHSASPLAHTERPSSSCLLDLGTFFNGIRSSSDKEKQKERQPERKAPQVIDVPLGTATPGDVVGVDDGVRPYVLFFYLSWFQKKKKKPDPPRPVYDDELEDDESEHAILDVHIATTRTQIDTRKDMGLTPTTFFQSQPEAGPFRPAPPVDDEREVDIVDVPIPTTSMKKWN
ncbi:WD40-repeat-containing domain protein [Suillus lakei]|nr:WD40-repeat-containing domain protein [Suillus lakei]